ncbi:MAG: hypothetical protein LC808_06435 [Actinobacteria bacterium]|nr:hypothetical protein [Actinomycetota bacterium]
MKRADLFTAGAGALLGVVVVVVAPATVVVVPRSAVVVVVSRVVEVDPAVVVVVALTVVVVVGLVVVVWAPAPARLSVTKMPTDAVASATAPQTLCFSTFFIPSPVPLSPSRRRHR